MPPQSAPRKKPVSRRLLAVGCLILLINPVTLAIGLRTFFFEAFAIEGPASEPNYASGDRVVVGRASYGLWLPFASGALATWGQPERGDVVVLQNPYDGFDLIKRVIGLPGDTIAGDVDGGIIVNGNPLPRERLGLASAEEQTCYREGDSEPYVVLLHDEVAESFGPLRVPPGRVFVLGDNRSRSNDSRHFGTIPIANVKGRVLFHYLRSSARIRCPTLPQ